MFAPATTAMATSNEIITSYDVNVVITKQGDARIKEVINSDFGEFLRPRSNLS